MQIEGTDRVVFGGASGLGEATARRLADGGAAVVVADIAEDRARRSPRRSAASRCLRRGRPAAVRGAVDRRADRAGVADLGRLRGPGDPGKLIGREGPTPLEHFTQVITVNLLGTINALRLAAFAMQQTPPMAAVSAASA